MWAAVGDFATGPLRTTPGVFTDCRLEEPGVRTLTFADGTGAHHVAGAAMDAAAPSFRSALANTS